MTPLYMQIIATLAASAALSILFFDKRQRQHNTAACIVAWLLFCLYGCLLLAALMNLQSITQWLLLLVLVLNVSDVVLAGGNISKVLPETLHNTFCKPKAKAIKSKRRYFIPGEHHHVE